jgi:hypothetical protein
LARDAFRRAHAGQRDDVGTADQRPRSDPTFGAAFCPPYEKRERKTEAALKLRGSIIAMMIVSVLVIIPVPMNPQRAIDATDDATRHAAHNTADNAANRSECTVAGPGAFPRTFTGTFTDALGLCGDRDRQYGEKAGGSHHLIRFHHRVPSA